MAAGDMAAGEDHDHEHGTNGQRSERPRRQADGEHEEERADELNEVFFHGVEEWAELVHGPAFLKLL